MTSLDASSTKRMRLRYAGVCRGCQTSIPQGAVAIYHRTGKQVECLECADLTGLGVELPIDAGQPPPGPASEEPAAGVAGASARREHQRRQAKREAKVRAAHPRLGGLILALTDEPQSTRAWDTGARGEELLAKRLDSLQDRGVRLLHDRQIPRTRANIDHLAISAAGVFVIDAKRYNGRPLLRVEGGIIRPRTCTLTVGGRDQSKLVHGMHKQLSLVRAALAGETAFLDVPVRGMLCFIQADWPVIGGAFTIDEVDVLWPAKAADKIAGPGQLSPEQVAALQRHLAVAFPIA